MSNAKLDENSRPALTAIDSSGTGAIVQLYADPSTHRLLVDLVGGGTTTVDAGTTTTGAPGTNASVVNSGTTTNAVFDFTIPRGNTGTTGSTGASGTPAVISDTSTTSRLIEIASKVFTVSSATNNWVIGDWLIIASTANTANFMSGPITNYTGTSLTVNVTKIGGSGTHSDWNISLSGIPGADGAGSGTVNSITDGSTTVSNPAQVRFVGSTVSNVGGVAYVGGLVPYTGATSTLAMGTNSITISDALGTSYLDIVNSFGHVALGTSGYLFYGTYTGKKTVYIAESNHPFYVGGTAPDSDYFAIDYAGNTTIGGTLSIYSNGNNNTSSKYTIFQGSGGQAANVTYTLPTALPAVTGYVLSATNAGVMSWVDNAAGSGTVSSVSVVTNQGVSGSVATATTTPAITLSLGALTGVTSFNGLVVTANTGAITTGSWAATAIPLTKGGTGTDLSAIAKGGLISGTGAATVGITTVGADGTVLSADAASAGGIKWIAAGGTGTVTTVSVASANGFAGTVANATTTPAITLTTSITGVLKGNGTAISAATDGTDYLSSTTGLKLDQTSSQTIVNGQPIFDTLTASQIVATDANKKLQTLAVATYPSLTELSYVKGVTSGIQAQLNSKGTGNGTVTASGGALTSNAVVLGAGTIDTKVSTGINTNGTAQLILGVNTTTLGSVKMFGNTSGDVTIQPNAIAGTGITLTLPATTGTLVTGGGTASGTNTGDNATNSTYTTLATTLGTANTWTAVQTFTNSDIRLLGSSTGYTTFTSGNASASNYTLTFPAVTDTLAGLGTAQTWTATQTFYRVNDYNNAITASGNAATVPITYRLNTVTNNSAATLTITMTTTSAVDGQMSMVRILDSSAAAQTITWVNTENSTVTAPTTSNGSTTLPLTVGFQYNNATSKWRCIASA